MADPRLTLDYEHIDPQTVTFSIDNSTITFDATEPGGSASVGLAVKLSGNATVALTTDGSRVLGKLMLVEWDGKCTVMTGGFMYLPSGAGATLTVGEAVVGDLDGTDAGYIRAVATATAAELGHAHGTIIDSSDADAVVIRL
jgi:hypothetical protein